MKKSLLLFICILSYLCVPNFVKAAEITSTQIEGMSEKTIGEEITLDFKINFSGLEKGLEQRLGIWLVTFELIFDEDVFIVSEITSNDFESYVFKEEGKYYVYSEVIENQSSQNHCAYGLLYCSNYTVSIKFYIKNTELTSSTIEMGETEVGLLDMIDDEKTYTVDDLIILNTTANKSHLINIKTTTEEVKTEPEKVTDITTNNNNPIENKPQTTLKNTTTESTTTAETKKSSNSFIKELKIDNYEIDFDKNKTDYNLEVKKDTNELKINVTLEDTKATYKIIGADDLKTNDYKVSIEVTAEDESKTVYNINIKLEEETEPVINEEEIVEDEKNIKATIFTKKNLIYGGIILGIILLIIIIVSIINKKQNKKIDNLLDKI